MNPGPRADSSHGQPLSPNVRHVAAMFGLNLDGQGPTLLIPPTTIELAAHQLVFVTGDSGGGKSTLLRLIHDQLVAEPNAELRADQRETSPRVVRFDDLPAPPDSPLVDCFGRLPLDRTLSLLSRAGLNDAFVLLRRPTELSDGQRERFNLARLMHEAESSPAAFTVILADEFAARLDRTTASVLARNVRKWTRSAPVCFVAATTHDDLLEPLEPDVLIDKPLGPRIHVLSK